MKQIVIISGKGGTGKTVITAAFASLVKNKVMVDCDVDAADLHLLLNPKILERHEFKSGKTAVIDGGKCNQCGMCLEVCRFDAITQSSIGSQQSTVTIDPISCEGCGVCSLICPQEAITMKECISGEWFISDTQYGPFVHAKLGIAEENSGKLVTLVRQNAKLIADKENRDIIIIDGSPGIGCPVISSISGIDCALIVTEPTLSGLHDLIRVVELTRHFNVKTFVVINKYDLNTEMAEEIESYCRNNGVALAGKIKYDTAIIEAMVNKKTVIEYSKGEVSQQIKNVWEIIQNELD
ncbi:MAG: ATP-binding protein [Bacteroidetes bacterium]|nr:ATP-binding protein [Bacteroidota bacterium]